MGRHDPAHAQGRQALYRPDRHHPALRRRRGGDRLPAHFQGRFGRDPADRGTEGHPALHRGGRCDQRGGFHHQHPAGLHRVLDHRQEPGRQHPAVERRGAPPLRLRRGGSGRQGQLVDPAHPRGRPGRQAGRNPRRRHPGRQMGRHHPADAQERQPLHRPRRHHPAPRRRREARRLPAHFQGHFGRNPPHRGVEGHPALHPLPDRVEHRCADDHRPAGHHLRCEQADGGAHRPGAGGVDRLAVQELFHRPAARRGRRQAGAAPGQGDQLRAHRPPPGRARNPGVLQRLHLPQCPGQAAGGLRRRPRHHRPEAPGAAVARFRGLQPRPDRGLGGRPDHGGPLRHHQRRQRAHVPDERLFPRGADRHPVRRLLRRPGAGRGRGAGDLRQGAGHQLRAHPGHKGGAAPAGIVQRLGIPGPGGRSARHLRQRPRHHRAGAAAGPARRRAHLQPRPDRSLPGRPHHRGPDAQHHRRQ